MEMRFFTLLLVGLVLSPVGAHAASLYLDPDSASYGPGDTFMVAVRVDNEDECINAGEIHISYPKTALRAVDVSRGDSMFTLWIEEPQIDHGKGAVHFAGGVPGGYCGRIQGDPALSNVLGRIVFTVIQTDDKKAAIDLLPQSALYLNDGLGTQAILKTSGTQVTLLPEAKGINNPWLEEVNNDDIPPDPFTVETHETEGVFGGRRYIVFTTVDKQSGIDHYEIFEKDIWKTITSPYPLRYQIFPQAIQVRAVDKAGNTRLADFGDPETANPRINLPGYVWLLGGLFSTVILAILAFLFWYMRSKKKNEGNVSL